MRPRLRPAVSPSAPGSDWRPTSGSAPRSLAAPRGQLAKDEVPVLVRFAGHFEFDQVAALEAAEGALVLDRELHGHLRPFERGDRVVVQLHLAAGDVQVGDPAGTAMRNPRGARAGRAAGRLGLARAP